MSARSRPCRARYHGGWPAEDTGRRADEARRASVTLLHHIAYTGLFFWGPSTNLYVVTVLGVLGLGGSGLSPA